MTRPSHNYPDTVVRRARLLYQRGYKPSEIRMHLKDEGIDISYETIRNWIYCGARGGRAF